MSSVSAATLAIRSPALTAFSVHASVAWSDRPIHRPASWLFRRTADGRAAAAFAAGANAVCVGTRLVAREKRAAHREYKIRLVTSEFEDTVIATVFDPEWPGAPMRVLMNTAVPRALAPPAER